MAEARVELDERGNSVPTTHFESYLAKFILEHPGLYEAAFMKLFDGMKSVFAQDDRTQYSVFSLLSAQYRSHESFDSFEENFSLPAADYLLKLATDYVFRPDSPAMILYRSSSPDDTRSPFNPNRNPQLFSEENRGVTETESGDVPPTKALGIVSSAHRPDEFENYFEEEIEPAGLNYLPNERSYVAQWLRAHYCPVIAGTSGSTEAVISRIFPLIELTKEEQKLIIFAQACNMIANGHHSLFEALMVANNLELIEIAETDTQKAFYLQCVPDSILADDAFQAFINSDRINALLSGIRAIENNEEDELDDSHAPRV